MLPYTIYTFSYFSSHGAAAKADRLPATDPSHQLKTVHSHHQHHQAYGLINCMRNSKSTDISLYRSLIKPLVVVVVKSTAM